MLSLVDVVIASRHNEETFDTLGGNHLPVQLLALAGPPDVFGRIGGLQRSSCREVQSRFLLQISAVGYQCPCVDALIFRRNPTLKTLSPWFASVMRRFGFAGLGLLPKFAVIRPFRGLP